MRCLVATTFIALLTSAAPAVAQDAGRVTGVERRLELYEAHQSRLERQLDGQSSRIARLKKQPGGVGRDLQLKTALRSSRELASRLTRMQGQLRELRSSLLDLYDRAIGETKDSATRQMWQERRRKLLARSAPRSAKIVTAKIVIGARANPLDGVEDLEEKADLLADSEAKVRQQLQRLSKHIARIERRVKLRRHGRAATDTPFVEDSTRRLGGSRRVTTPSKGSTEAARDDGKASETPPPAVPGGMNADPKSGLAGAGSPNPSPSYDAASGASGASGAAPLRSSTLQRALDPATLEALAGSRKGSLAARLAALKKARDNLDRLAKGLAERAAALRKRAGALKTQPRKTRPRK